MWRVLQRVEVLVHIRNFLIVSTTEKRLCSSLNSDNIDMAWSWCQNVRTMNCRIILRTNDVYIYILFALLIQEASIPMSWKISEIVWELFCRLKLFVVERRPGKINSIIQKLESDLKRCKNKQRRNWGKQMGKNLIAVTVNAYKTFLWGTAIKFCGF